MQQYIDIAKNVLDNGLYKENRTGEGTFSISGAMFEFDMSTGKFPLLTTKKMGLKTIFAELEFFIKGLTDKKWLQERGCHIWDEWCNPTKVPYSNDKEVQKKMLAENDLGKIYGYQWNNFNGVNQLEELITTLKTNPNSRRMIVSAWNPSDLDKMALPPCHYGFQLISDGEYLDLLWSQRSVDVALGLPFNIASYAMLLKLISKQVGMKPRKLVGFLGDVHVYESHIKNLELQIKRKPLELPSVEILDNDRKNWTIWDWEFTDFSLLEYKSHEKLSYNIAV